MAALRFVGYASDLFERCRVFKSRSVARLLSKISRTRGAAHHLCVSRFRYVADENHFARRERFAEIACDVLFQFRCEGDPALPDQFAFFFNTQEQTNASPLIEFGTPIPAASLASACATRINSKIFGDTNRSCREQTPDSCAYFEL